MAEAPLYGVQDRGDAARYQSYYAGMDKTMRQKLAFVGAHFLLDPGPGSPIWAAAPAPISSR